jgi:hypothetical protein
VNGDWIYRTIVLTHEKGKFRDDPKPGDLPETFEKTFGKKRVLSVADMR